MKDGKNGSWWCDDSNPMLMHGAICCRCYAAGCPVVSPNRSIESRYIFAKAQIEKSPVGLPKIHLLALRAGKTS